MGAWDGREGVQSLFWDWVKAPVRASTRALPQVVQRLTCASACSTAACTASGGRQYLQKVHRLAGRWGQRAGHGPLPTSASNCRQLRRWQYGNGGAR